MKKTILYMNIIIAILVIFLFSCRDNRTQEETAYIEQVLKFREQKDEFMAKDPSSPFNAKGRVEFHKLIYFDIDSSFKFQSKLFEYPVKDSLMIYGTKGEARETQRYGYLEFLHEGINRRINVYKSKSRNGEIYFGIWFTDQTTNSETYGVGRYLDFELNEDPDYVYTIDFNLAYNPYCAYSPDYSCAVPTKEDHLNFEVRAGEKKFHE